MVFSSDDYLKLEQFMRRLQKGLHLKNGIYKIAISISQLIAIKKLSRQVKKLKDIKMDEEIEPSKIYFNTVDARYTPSTFFESAIAKSLELRGHKVKMLLCGGLLDSCPAHFTVDKPKTRWHCDENCIRFSKKFYDTIKLPYANYGEYISEKEKNDLKEKIKNVPFSECKDLLYKTVNVGTHAVTSADRYFKGMRPSDEQYEKVLRDELLNAFISVDIADKILTDERPDIIVTSQGCYSTWGCFAEYFINFGIDVRIWDSGETETVTFDNYKSDEQYEKWLEMR